MQVKQVTKIEQAIIDKVRTVRNSMNISQATIEDTAGFAHGFIGKVESPNRKEKYNFNHINEIALVLGCKLWDLIPERPLKNQK